MKTLKEIAKEIKQVIKKENPGVKLSIRTDVTSISIAITQLPFNPFLDKEQIEKNLINEPQYVLDGILKDIEQGNYGINHYYVDKDSGLKDEAKTLINKILKMAQSGQHDYNVGDLTADYCNFNFYVNVGIGRYDKPVVIKEAN